MAELSFSISPSISCGGRMRWRRFCSSFLYLFMSVCAISHLPVSHGSAVTVLDNTNFESLVGGAEIVFVNFYADWCRFSQMLAPIFEEAAEKFKDEPQTKVVFGKVDCDRQVEIATKYHINKYPTLKYFRNGQLAKREYRGQRSATAFAEFVNNQLHGSVTEFTSHQELEEKLDKNKRSVIAYFQSKEGVEYDNFKRVSSNLREECDFWVGIGPNFAQQTVGGSNIAFRPPKSSNEDQVFSGNIADFEYVRSWVTDKCIPLVRDITFENAEELTEEGLPFLILFRDPNDAAILEAYTQEVARQLADQKTAINFLVADGKKFAHPLHHLGKSEKDLPVLAIDSFRHMYLFPDTKEMASPGKLRQFVLDLHSGKLHREFHHGPDTSTPVPDGQAPGQIEGGPPAHPGPPGQQPPAPREQPKTSPPESVFEKLKPSRNRYTILKDEL